MCAFGFPVRSQVVEIAQPARSKIAKMSGPISQ
jgi:hypothetical protein